MEGGFYMSIKFKKNSTNSKSPHVLIVANLIHCPFLQKYIVLRIRKNNGEQKKTVYMDYKDKISERNFKAIWLYQTWKHIIP